MAVNHKWDKIETEVDMRAHKHAMGGDRPSPEPEEKVSSSSRAAQRIYGPGGIMQKLMRKTYRQGLRKLETHSFKDETEKQTFIEFRDQLKPEEKDMVSAPSFK